MNKKNNLTTKGTFDLAYQNHQKNNFQVAENYYRKILKADPKHFASTYLLGTLLLQTNKFKMAKEMLEKSIQINPDKVDAYNNLGITLQKLGEFQESIECYQKAIEIRPDYAYAHNNLGNTLKELKKFKEAKNHYQKAIKIKPDFIDAHKNLMQMFETMNQDEELKDAILKARTLIKDNPIINLYEGILLCKNEKFAEAKNCLESISFGSREINKEILRVSNLAKCYDRIGDYEKAFDFFLKTNDLAPQKTDVENFDKGRFLKEIRIRGEFFKKFKMDERHTLKSSNKRPDPIFLIGFPRSGTTLLDVILDSHPKVEVIEEKNIVGKLINSLNELPGGNLECLKNMQNDQLKKIRDVYFDSLESTIKNKSNSKIYIDKFPLNIVYVGEIVRVFPNSKFVLSLRHPCDCVLSCFMQNFQLNDAMANFLNLEDSAHLYDAVMNLWTQYTSIFSINYHEVKYENLVENFERTVRSVLDFLGLSWNSSLLEYSKTAKERIRISTPSYHQVIKPLYSHSSGRWKRYEKQTANVYPILETWIKKFNYYIHSKT